MKAQLYIFNDSFVYVSHNPKYTEDGTLFSTSWDTSEIQILDRDSTPLTDVTVYEDLNIVFFPHTIDGVQFISVNYERPLEGYESIDGNLKTIDQETYDKLTPSFQEKYRKIQGEKVRKETVFTPQSVTYAQDFDLDVYRGETEHPLVRIQRQARRWGYSRDNQPRPGFHNFDKAQLTPEMIVEALRMIYIERDGDGIGRQWIVRFFGATPSRNEDLSIVEITYLEKPWEGETKKQYARKKNGGFYADGRGKMVPELAQPVSHVSVTAEDMRAIPFKQAQTNDEQWEILETVYDTLFVNH